MKSTKIKDLIPSSEYDLDRFLTIVLFEENKSGKWDSQKVGKVITSISFDKFFDNLNCQKKDAIRSSFRINDLVNKSIREKQI